MHSSELAIRSDNGQGNTSLPILNSKNDGVMKEIDRSNAELDYHNNFPKVSSNFDRPVPRKMNEKNDQYPTNNFNKKDHIPEPAPYTIVQTYAHRLRHNQDKKGVSIKLTEPEITSKQGLPAVLYVKDELVKDLASTCKFTLIGKFIYTMPRVDLIRKNFILQTQLSGGVKIAILILGMCT